jgi:hypothetical protein
LGTEERKGIEHDHEHEHEHEEEDEDEDEEEGKSRGDVGCWMLDVGSARESRALPIPSG